MAVYRRCKAVPASLATPPTTLQPAGTAGGGAAAPHAVACYDRVKRRNERTTDGRSSEHARFRRRAGYHPVDLAERRAERLARLLAEGVGTT